MDKFPHVLILGGTAEAVRLTCRLAGDCAITYSLAGRTQTPVLPQGVEVRKGGFGGVRALRRWLQGQGVDAVIDATHPFATVIAGNVACAAEEADIPRLKLLRSAWVEMPGDRWLRTRSLAEASAVLSSEWHTVFLSVGRQGLHAFSGIRGIRFVVRSVDPIGDCPLKDAVQLVGRGPFRTEDETELLSMYQIDAVVSRNSGGDATYGKIAAARSLGLPVVMIEPPPPPAGACVDTVEAAADWLNDILSGAG